MANAYCLWLRSNFPMRSNLRYFSILPPPSSNGRKLILSSHNSSPPFFLSVIRFKRYLCRVNRTAPFTCVIQRRISSQRHDRSRKSVMRDEIPPKWITCSRLLHPDLARGFDMEDRGAYFQLAACRLDSD